MAVDLYRDIANPLSGETFRCLAITPDAYIMQWTLQPMGYVPFEHIHFQQDEIFQVQKGELKVIVDGVTHIARPGGKIVVPMGKPHVASNNREEVMEAVVSYTPALDQETFSKCFCGLILDGHVDSKGGINIPRMGYFIRKMKCNAMARPVNIPAPAFNMALNVFYLMGTLRGWGKLYRKYTM